MSKQTNANPIPQLIIGVAVLTGLYVIGRSNYLLFHSLAELFSIVIACCVFVLAWNTRRFLDNDYLPFLGIAYLFVAGLDAIHTLAYKGMGVFPGYDADLPTQLWIAARYLQSLSLLVAPLLVGKTAQSQRKRHLNLNLNLVIASYAAITALLLGTIFHWNVFPACYVAGVGLTPFKIVSEYVIIFILLIAAGLLWRRRDALDRRVLNLLLGAIVATIGAEIAFTNYVGVYDFANKIGHYFKIVSFYVTYVALVETGLRQPYRLLFRDLKQSEEQLQIALAEKETLLREIHHRIKNNMQSLIYLIDMQADTIADPEILHTLDDLQGRVRAMALIHSRLYQSHDIAQIDFGAYLEELATYLIHASRRGLDVSLHVDAEDAPIAFSAAIPCGLIVNELLTNALKHAFPPGHDKDCRVSVSFESHKNECALIVSDNGVGLSPDLDWQTTDSLGLKLVKIWAVHQLSGEINVDTQGGTTFSITFPKKIE